MTESDRSPVFVDHARRSRNRGRLDHADAVGSAGGRECPDKIEISLRIADDIIVEARFECQGCDDMVACGSILTEMVTGLHLDDAAEVSSDAVIQAIGPLPEDKRHVAHQAVEALDNAMWNFIVREIEQREP